MFTVWFHPVEYIPEPYDTLEEASAVANEAARTDPAVEWATVTDDDTAPLYLTEKEEAPIA